MDEISDLLKKSAKKPENKRIHSQAHALADEISSFFNEKKRFGMYLGIIKRIGVSRAREYFSRIKSERGTVDNPKKLFMWLSRNAKPETKDSLGGDVNEDIAPPDKA